MTAKLRASGVALLVGLTAAAPGARADGVRFPGTRSLGMGGALRAVATGDTGPMLNPSGISLIHSYQVEGAYQYDKSAGAQDARISAVDSTSNFNLGGALFYSYHYDSVGGGPAETGHLAGASLSFPFADKVFLGGTAKYIHFGDASGTVRSGFTFDAGVTIRPFLPLSIALVGYNLVDHDTRWAPKGIGGGVAVMPVPMLLLTFDTVVEKVYGASSSQQATYYMGGGELSFSSSGAIRAGGGRDGLTRNGYISAGLSVFSADAGALDVGLRQDISGANRSTILGLSARLFVPGM